MEIPKPGELWVFGGPTIAMACKFMIEKCIPCDCPNPHSHSSSSQDGLYHIFASLILGSDGEDFRVPNSIHYSYWYPDKDFFKKLRDY